MRVVRLDPFRINLDSPEQSSQIFFIPVGQVFNDIGRVINQRCNIIRCYERSAGKILSVIEKLCHEELNQLLAFGVREVFIRRGHSILSKYLFLIYAVYGYLRSAAARFNNDLIKQIKHEFPVSL